MTKDMTLHLYFEDGWLAEDHECRSPHLLVHNCFDGGVTSKQTAGQAKLSETEEPVCDSFGPKNNGLSSVIVAGPLTVIAERIVRDGHHWQRRNASWHLGQLAGWLAGTEHILGRPGAQQCTRQRDQLVSGGERIRPRKRRDSRKSKDRRSNTPGRIRTCDLRFRKPLLYPLSYRRVLW